MQKLIQRGFKAWYQLGVIASKVERQAIEESLQQKQQDELITRQNAIRFANLQAQNNRYKGKLNG